MIRPEQNWRLPLTIWDRQYVSLQGVLGIFNYFRRTHIFFETYGNLRLAHMRLAQDARIFFLRYWFVYPQAFWDWIMMDPIPAIMPEATPIQQMLPRAELPTIIGDGKL